MIPLNSKMRADPKSLMQFPCTFASRGHARVSEVLTAVRFLDKRLLGVCLSDYADNGVNDRAASTTRLDPIRR